MTTVVVGGAGIAGLAAAWELKRAGVDAIVLESERRAGGVIVTERPEPGWIVEGGPDGFHASDSAIPELAAELGIAGRLIRAATRGTFGWDGTGFHPLSGLEAAELLGIEARAIDPKAGYQSFAAGMEELVEALVRAVVPAMMRVGVTAAHRTARGFRVSAAGGGGGTECDGLVVALPAYAAARLFPGLDGRVRALLEEVRYRPSVTVSLAYARDQVREPLDGTGFVVQPGVASPLRACTYASVKFRGRAPEGAVLLRAFLAPGIEAAATTAHEALARILGIEGRPRWARDFDWPRGLPDRRGGEHERAAWRAELDRRIERLGPIALAGAAYDGPGVSACVRSGRAAARRVLAALGAPAA
ncbi:MAG: protoporphyrinogen/coproporphyrinogen oxidase [Gemmatimonadales bacterium]